MTPSPLFNLDGKVVVITGGAGLLGFQHAKAIASANGIPILWDLHIKKPHLIGEPFHRELGPHATIMKVDITNPKAVAAAVKATIKRYRRIDVLINNAANNPKVEKTSNVEFSRLENFSLAQWQADLDVGLTGAFLCSQAIGKEMAKRGEGIIINVASDLGIIAPDQRIYHKKGLSREQQPVKPISYSIVKSGLLGLTRYLATYWCDQGVRCNAISPGGIENEQNIHFIKKLSNLIPLGRMAKLNEYEGAILFLCSQASSYMNGANLIIDGGRSCW